MLSETTGERIARLRERARLTQAQLSERTGDVVSEAWIAAAEKGRIKNPKRDMLEPIAKVLEVPLAYLTEPLGWIPAPDPGTVDTMEQIVQALLDNDDLDPEIRDGLILSAKLHFGPHLTEARRKRKATPRKDHRRTG